MFSSTGITPGVVQRSVLRQSRQCFRICVTRINGAQRTDRQPSKFFEKLWNAIPGHRAPVVKELCQVFVIFRANLLSSNGTDYDVQARLPPAHRHTC